PFHAAANWRYRPTVTRYLSRRKLLMVAGSAWPVGPLPLFRYVLLYVPPVTSRLMQQFSRPEPQSVIPGPPGAQLGAVAPLPLVPPVPVPPAPLAPPLPPVARVPPVPPPPVT